MKTRAIIKLPAIAHNLAIARAHAPDNKVMAVVKADAYGHGSAGLLPVLRQHTEGLAVARLEEAQALREAGYEGKLLLLSGVTDHEALTTALLSRLDIVVHDDSHLAMLTRYVHPHPHRSTLWLKLDTGMHRLGFAPQDFANAFNTLKTIPWCEQVIGMTHFASADETDNPKTAQQIACYREWTKDLELDGHSLANSAGLLAWPGARTGWLRPGLMMYGVNPLPGNLDLQAAMQMEAQVIGIKTISQGDTVGYNEQWHAARDTRVAFIAAGYADGYPVTVRNNAYVALDGVRAPIIGRVSMDTIAIDCTDIATPSLGDWAELWGEHISVREVANWAGTIPYQLLTDLSLRVERIYR
ncbi:MAG TPA: alanine racemase [Pseudomonadales bacterium]|nr:alanine racemase [Pseudomonadales bacterium]